ncbi:hypothetical protein J5N97_016155 [Dioscorea zingiberensis]|uniref:Replication factor C subunit 1 n=1 Tax=Dioscorea zingiberensis TaxID=325984 RepID=A0A9D5HF55_9LILI|nr:hypothetical protein J5N97_016155 [Dioscorea zingiberensis]
MSDIRKWFMKQHDKGNASAPAKPAAPPPEKPAEKPAQAVQENSGRRKTSKYFAKAAAADTSPKEKVKDETANKRATARKTREVFLDDDDDVKPSPAKKLHKDEDDDFVLPNKTKKSTPAKPAKKLKNAAGLGVAKHPADDEDESEKEELDHKVVETPVKVGGRGKGGDEESGVTAGGRGRGGGRGGFMNFSERKDPPHKGEKEVPEGAPDCLAGLTFVISGTLDSTNFLTEDGLFDMIRKTIPVKVSPQKDLKKKIGGKADSSQVKSSPQKHDTKDNQSSSLIKKSSVGSFDKRKSGDGNSLTWTEKYRPKVPNDIVGNQSIIKQLHDWLARWNEQFLQTGQKGKGRKQNDSGFKKAVLLSGSPGIGKSTTAGCPPSEDNLLVFFSFLGPNVGSN